MRLTCLAALAASALLYACGGVSNQNQCVKGTNTCASDSVARLCADDGTLVDQTCDQASICMGGSCVARTDVACKPSDSSCTDSTHAVVCNDNGMGFKAVTCPANTTCEGTGDCVGTCVVGSSRCASGDVVETCMDGFTYVQANCSPGTTSCVDTTAPGARLNTAACMPMGCQPSGTVCGDKAADPASTDTSYASQCVSSPTGTHWESEKCLQPNSCQPNSGCTATCIPGQTRCNGNGVQTCDSTGNWMAPMACTTAATGNVQTCVYAGAYSNPVCGDAVCNAAPGACEADGYHACVNGKVSASATPCTQGTCVSTTMVNGYIGGSCQTECVPGDTKCNGPGAFQTCTAQGRWSATNQTCTPNGTDSCVQYSDPQTNRPRAVCGVCVPGSHRCTDSAGNVGGSPPTDIEQCDSSGHYAAHAACGFGQCEYSINDYACVGQCVPGATVCVGAAPASPPNPEHPGTVNYGMCDTNGNLPPASGGTACPGGTSCRVGPNGQPVGSGMAACVACVGPNITGGNELGLTDSYCPAGNSLEVCTASNTWGGTATCSSSSPYTGTCRQETPYRQAQVCNGYYYCRDSNIQANYGSGHGCDYFWGGSYGVNSWGGVSDCCATPSCSQSNSIYAPGPAVCQ